MFNNLSARHIWLLTPALVVAYVGVAWLSGLLFASYGLRPPPIWLASAISIAAIWHFKYYALPGIFLGTLLAYWVQPGSEMNLTVAACAAGGEFVGAITANRIMNARPGAVPPFGRMKHLGRFLLGSSLLMPLMTATVGTIAHAVVQRVSASDLFYVWLKWCLSGATGVLLFAPLLMLMLHYKPGDKITFSTESTLALIITALLAIWVYWFADRQTYAVYALPYLIVLPLAWAALKFDLRITIATLLTKETIALFGTLQGAGALHATGDPHAIDTLTLITLVTAPSVYGANVLINELRHRHRAQRQANRYLAAQVEERTEKLAASEARFRSYFNAGLIGLGEIAPDGRWVLVNNHLRYLLGYTQTELGEMRFDAIVHASDRKLNKERFDSICSGKIEAYTLELRLVRKNDQTIPALLSARAARRADGTLDFIFVVIDDITQHKVLEAELKRQATVDYLTGLYNRRYFTELASKEIDRALRHKSPTALLIFDVDHFKAINDKLGHLTGDAVLKRLGDLCHDSLRSFDIIGRIGGEEFAVLLPNTVLAGAFDIAERLRLAVANQPAANGKGKAAPGITISIGVALLQPGEKLEPLFSRADAALYRAKKGGRNRVELASST